MSIFDMSWEDMPLKQYSLSLRDIDKEIKETVDKLARLKAEKEKEEEAAWPKPYSFFVYNSDEDASYDEGVKLKLPIDVAANFQPGYEVEFSGFVTKDGKFTCHTVNGVALVKPTEL